MSPFTEHTSPLSQLLLQGTFQWVSSSDGPPQVGFRVHFRGTVGPGV